MATLLERANEKLRERKKVALEARALLEKEDITPEDREQHATMLEDCQRLKDESEDFRKQHELDGSINDLPEPKSGRGNQKTEPKEPWEMRLKAGSPGREVERVYTVEADDPAYHRTTRKYNRAYHDMLASTNIEGYIRSLSAVDDTEGGYTQPPQQFIAQLIQAVDDAATIRPLATVHQVPQAESLGAPVLTADPADATWTTELAIGSEDSTMAFGKRELRPNPLAKSIKVSKKLIRASAINMVGLVAERLGYKFGITENKAFLTGTGANQPLGVFTADADGISTGRDVSTGNLTTAIQFDGLIAAKYTLKGNYWPAARWIFHRDAVKTIAQLKDGEGQYQWQASTQAGQADRLLGLPFLTDENAPSTFTTGLYVGILGDFRNYWIADAMGMTIQTLVELYAAANQNGYIGRLETDGMPVLEEAFVRVKLA